MDKSVFTGTVREERISFYRPKEGKGGSEDVLMVDKATYEELERRLKELEEEAVERKRAGERIEHLNAVLLSIRNVNQLIAREKDRNMLLKGVCDSLIETRGYYNAWIALIAESGGLVRAAEAGLGNDFLPMLERLKRGELTECVRKTLRKRDVVVVEDPYSMCIDCPLAKKYSGGGAMTRRLEYGGKVYGLLSASIPIDLATDEDEQALFEEVAGDIAFALYSIELEEEHRRAERALRESEAQYHGIFDSAIDSFLIFDLNGDIVEANPQACRKYGYPHEELIKLSGKDIVHPDYYHLFEQFKRDVRMTGEFDCESMAVRYDQGDGQRHGTWVSFCLRYYQGAWGLH